MESFKKNKNKLLVSISDKKNLPSKSLNFNDMELKNFYNSEKIKRNLFNEEKDNKIPIDKMFGTEEDKIETIKNDELISERQILGVNNLENNSSFFNNNFNKNINKENSFDEAIQRLNPEKSIYSNRNRNSLVDISINPDSKKIHKENINNQKVVNENCKKE